MFSLTLTGIEKIQSSFIHFQKKSRDSLNSMSELAIKLTERIIFYNDIIRLFHRLMVDRPRGQTFEQNKQEQSNDKLICFHGCILVVK